MYRKLLKIPEGYKVEKIEVIEEEIHVQMRPYKRKAAICSGCGSVHKKGYHSSTVTKARDLPSGGQVVYLHVTKRKYRCPADGKIYVEQVEWLKKKKELPLDLLKKFIV